MIPGTAKPSAFPMSGLTGEAATALRFDLYVQGFAFTNAESAQYLITGSNNGNLQARASDPHNKSTLVSKAYSRRIAAAAGPCVRGRLRPALPQHAKGIAQTKIAFKGENSPTSEIYLADFDGHNAQAVTRDNNIVAAPAGCRGTWRCTTFPTSSTTRTSSITTSPRARAGLSPVDGSNMSPAALARRQQSGVYFEHGRLDGPVCRQCRRQRPEAADQVAAG